MIFIIQEGIVFINILLFDRLPVDMKNRLNQRLQRKYTVQASDDNTQHPDRAGPERKSDDQNAQENNQETLDGGAETPSYLCFVKYALILTLLFCLFFTLPLCLIIHFNGSSNGTFLNSLSILPLISTTSLQLLSYLSLPVFILHLIFLIILSLKFKHIQKQTDFSKRLPTGYALLLRIPPPQLNEEQICHQIEAWFRRELKFNKKFAETFPELSQPPQEISQIESSQCQQGQGVVKKLQSQIVEAVFLSYNYEQFQKISQEVQLVNFYMKEDNIQIKQNQMNNLLNLYNKRKNLRELLPVTEYSLVLFKLPKYAKYFYQRTKGNPLAKFFCVEMYSQFEIEQQTVEMVQGVLPNQIYWKNLHHSTCTLIKKRLLFLLIWFLLVSVGMALLFVSIYKELQTAVSALMISVWTIISNKILIIVHLRQPYAYYSKQKKAIIGYLWLLNMINLSFGPLAISYIISPLFISDSNHFIFEQLMTLIFFMVFSIADLLLNSLCRKRNQAYKAETDQGQGMQQLFANNLTIFSMVYFISAFFPLAFLFVVVWFALLLLLHRCNAKYAEIEYHGAKLMNSYLKYIRSAILCMLIGQISVFGFAATQLGIIWPISTIIIISLLAALTIMLEGIDLNTISCFKKQNQSELKTSLLNLNYSKANSDFVMTYQQYNFALDCCKNLQNGFSARLKIYQQLNTMSKTLSTSLKQRLFTNPHPIINNQNRVQKKSQDVNDIYFQYQRKVTMKKLQPKVPIPPLFKKEEEIERDPQENNQVEMMNFNSIFSQDDKEARKMLKQHIKRKLKGNEIQK